MILGENQKMRELKFGRKIILLFSGGLDSLACAQFYLNTNAFVTGLYVNYGQKSSCLEQEAALALSKRLGIRFKIITVEGGDKWGAGEVRGRNAFLLFLALMNCDNDTSIISMGIHSGTNYWDCSNAFIKQMQSMFDSLCGRRISIGCPFITFTKQEIYQYCIQEKLPISMTYSCENGTIPPCGTCLSCRDMGALI